MICETGPDWTLHQGGRPRGEGGRPAPGPDHLPVRSPSLRPRGEGVPDWTLESSR